MHRWNMYLYVRRMITNADFTTFINDLLSERQVSLFEAVTMIMRLSVDLEITVKSLQHYFDERLWFVLHWDQQWFSAVPLTYSGSK